MTTTLNLARGLSAEAVFWPLLRSDVPVHPDAPHHSYEGSIFEQPDGVADAEGALVEPAAGDRVLARIRSTLAPRPTATLTASIALHDDTQPFPRVRSAAPGGIMVGDPVDDGRVQLFGAYRRILADEAAALALAVLADGDSHGVDEIAALGDPDWQRQVIRELADASLLEVVA
jgi:hypothetical protein